MDSAISSAGCLFPSPVLFPKPDPMQQDRTTLIATVLVVVTGTIWGLYWVPVRKLAELGLPGAWGTLAIVATAAVLLAPAAIRRRHHLARSNPIALASIALGGAAFVLYSVGLLYGRVAIIVILFFLTPVWSTLIGRYVMGWPTTWLRIAALFLGLAGLALMLGADGQVPVPRGMGEWLGLISGFLWAVATTGIRAKADAGPSETAFVFAAGATISALILAPLLPPATDPEPVRNIPAIIGWSLLAGGVWWGLSMCALMWATARLEPARVGILLMIEVLTGAISAALMAGEHLGALEIAGGALVLCAGLCEVWPSRVAEPERT